MSDIYNKKERTKPTPRIQTTRNPRNNKRLDLCKFEKAKPNKQNKSNEEKKEMPRYATNNASNKAGKGLLHCSFWEKQVGRRSFRIAKDRWAGYRPQQTNFFPRDPCHR
jgi:hypothetical protein